MSKIPEEIRNKVVELWLDGYSYRAIESELMISLGSISSIIAAAKRCGLVPASNGQGDSS